MYECTFNRCLQKKKEEKSIVCGPGRTLTNTAILLIGNEMKGWRTCLTPTILPACTHSLLTAHDWCLHRVIISMLVDCLLVPHYLTCLRERPVIKQR